MDKKKRVIQEYLRPPVVAILGHVDHGKTSLLDAIRKTDVATREHGGITQAIGAFMVDHSGQRITFIDTPGHEAFAKMRGRGVKAADIVILVVAGDDGVMPQTKEAISHIKAANVLSIVAITKSDLPTSNPEKVKQQLAKQGISLEGQGGDIPVVLVSAKTGKGISDLLEVIVLLSQMANVGGELKGTFEGVVIEAKRDRRKGVLATLIVRNGTLAIGEEIRAEKVGGKIRALLNDVGQSIREATPGMPIEVLGFSNIPLVGSKVVKPSQATNPPVAQETTEKIVGHEPGKPRLVIILKADTQGSLEAIKESIPTDDVFIVLEGSGDPTEADVLLAKATKALIIGFNVTLPPSVAKLAETEGVIVKTYKLIYKVFEELREVITLLKEGGGIPTQEMILGKATVVTVFPYEKRKVAGCKVLEGRIAKGDKVRVERDGMLLGEGRVVSLRRGKEDISKAEMRSECGILLSTSLDFAPSDMILSVR